MKFSTTPDIVMAFYKTAGAFPDFEKWVKKTEPFRTTPAAKRPAAYKEQYALLRKQYDDFNPARDLLTVRTAVNLDLNSVYNAESDKTTNTIDMTFAEAPEAEYFPYDFFEDRFALVPIDLKNHLHAELPSEQYENFLKILHTLREVTLIMQLKPLQADAKKPVVMDGIPHWVLMTNIASMSLWSRQTGIMLWEYTAPWYVAPETLKLMDLYEEKTETAE